MRSSASAIGVSAWSWLAAASRTAAQPPVDKRASSCSYRSRSRAGTGSAAGSVAAPARCTGVSARPHSSSASGLPAVWTVSRSATTGAKSRPSSRAASPDDSPRSGWPSKSATAGSGAGPDRRVSRKVTRSCRNRRAANSSASVDSRSSQGRSSTTTSRGSASAAVASRPKVAAATAKRSPDSSGSAQPTAACRTCRWGSASIARCCRSAEVTPSRPAWASTVSDCTPWTQTVVQPSDAAERTAASATAVLPMPASPSTTSTPSLP